MAMNKDAADIIARFNRIPREVRAKVAPAVVKGADEIVGRMRYLAPDDTGELAASIHRKTGDVPLSVTIETENDAALYQEYGTREMARNSFFWPSVNSLKKRVRRRIDGAISRAIKDAWK
jgi:HK97 gp10 family phage protein